MNKLSPNGTITKASRIFREHGGILRTSEAIKLSIHPRVLYRMRSEGITEQLSRGLYRLKSMPPLNNPDIAQVAIKVPKGVICLISALAFHNITTQVPHEVYLALKKGDEPPRLSCPPLRIFWFSEETHQAGVEKHKTDGIIFRVYSAEKTIVDCFKYRNKIGLDVAIEALRLYKERKRLRLNDIDRYARLCRVQNVIRPYLEALV